MDELDYLQESMERTPPVTFRATIQDRCRICLIPMASHLLEDGLCIDCDMEVIQ
jgi:hypothetical protein